MRTRFTSISIYITRPNSPLIMPVMFTSHVVKIPESDSVSLVSFNFELESLSKPILFTRKVLGIMSVKHFLITIQYLSFFPICQMRFFTLYMIFISSAFHTQYLSAHVLEIAQPFKFLPFVVDIDICQGGCLGDR